MGRRERLLALALSFIVGCEVTARVGEVPDDGSSDTEESTDGSDCDTQTVETDETGSSDGSTESETDGSDSESDSQDDPCMPDPRAEPCELCTANLCCADLTVCVNTPSCQCMLDCVQTQTASECEMQCRPQAEYFSLVECVDDACPVVCR